MVILEEGYRAFHHSTDAEEWGIAHYGAWLSAIQEGARDPNSGIPFLLYTLTGCMYKIYNPFLRGVGKFDDAECSEYSKQISTIDNELRKFEIPEGIITYRYTKKECFASLFEEGVPKAGKTFTEKAFMHTTLVKDSLKSFARENRCDCILKLHLPHGTSGAYVQFADKSKLTEQEFLLPPNSTFCVTGKSYDLFRPVYSCHLIGQ